MRKVLVMATGLGASFFVHSQVRGEETKDRISVPRTAIVIGGGVIGVSTAFQLAQRGVQVTVVEAGPSLAKVASFSNGAILCQSMAASWASAAIMADNPGELQRLVVGQAALFSSSFWRWSGWFWLNSFMPGWAEYNHQSQRLLALFSLQCMEKELDQFAEQLIPAVNKTAKETIKLFHNKRDMEKFINSSQAKFWAEAGYPFEPLSKEEVLELEPSLAHDPDLVGGVRCSVDSSGDVHKYTLGLANLAKEHGVRFQFGNKVRQLVVEDRKVTQVLLENNMEPLFADIVVLAAGVASPALASNVGVNLPVYPLKGHMATAKYSGTGQALSRNIYSPRDGLASPLAPDLIRVAGGVEAVGWDFTLEPEKGREQLERMSSAFRPGVLGGNITTHSCLRPVSGDDVALIGPTGQVSNLYVNTGHGSKGWTYSWGSAVLLAQIVCGEQPGIEPKR